MEKVFPTKDEAIAEAIKTASDGETIIVHEKTCLGEECSCDPLVLTNKGSG